MKDDVGDAPITIIPLARNKAARRGITEELILDAVCRPDQTTAGHGGRTVAQKILQVRDKKYLLRVVYEEIQGQRTVITAYLTSDIARYWETPAYEN